MYQNLFLLCRPICLCIRLRLFNRKFDCHHRNIILVLVSTVTLSDIDDKRFRSTIFCHCPVFTRISLRLREYRMAANGQQTWIRGSVASCALSKSIPGSVASCALSKSVWLYALSFRSEILHAEGQVFFSRISNFLHKLDSAQKK